MANNYKVKMKDIQNKYKFKIFCAGYEYDDTEIKSDIASLQNDVSGLQTSVSQKANITESGRYIELELNSLTYVLTAKLYDKNNNLISSSTPIDLPLESMIVNATYDSTTKSLIITLQNGNTTSIPLGDLISGLATEEDLEEVDAKVDANIEKISDLENELNQYKTIYNVLPKVEDEGEALTLNDTGNATLKMDLKGNTSQSEEPTPDAPVPVNVVSGDNEISVVGKNLLPISTLSTQTINGITFTNNNDGSYTFNGTNSGYTAFNLFTNLSFNGNYTYVMRDTATSGFVMYLQSSSGQGIGQATTHTTIDNAIGKMVIGINNGVSLNNVTIKPYVYKGDYDSTIEYEPYQGNTYNIDLGVKNLWNSEDMKSGFLPQSGSYPTTNPSFPNSKYILVPLMAGQKLTLSGSTRATGRVRCIDASTNQVVNAFTIGDTEYYYTTHTFGDGFYEATITAKKYFIVGIMDYGGTSNDLVVNYGATPQYISDTPIELCKIGNYQDYFGKSDGRNLCNVTFELGGIDTTTGQDGASTDRVRTKGYVEVKPNTTYTLSGVQGSRVVCFYNSSKAYLSYVVAGSQSTSGTFTTSNNTTYIRWYIIQTNTNIYEMLNEGSIALPYQPYGAGKWYLHKEIGKVVLNGSESGWHTSSLSVTGYKSYYVDSSIRINQDATGSKCNYFEYKTFNEWQSLLQATFIENSYQAIGIRVVETLAPTLEDFKTWLSTHNTIAYFVLATPTTTEITNTTLISQLDELETAMSYKEQTNISQINNDAPFIIDATALKDLSNL